MVRTRSPLGWIGHAVSWFGLAVMSLLVAYMTVVDASFPLPGVFDERSILGLALANTGASLWRLHRAAPEDRLARSATLFAVQGSALVILTVIFLIALYVQVPQAFAGLGLVVLIAFVLFFGAVGAGTAVAGAKVRAERGRHSHREDPLQAPADRK
jgi:hypothetical protein